MTSLPQLEVDGSPKVPHAGPPPDKQCSSTNPTKGSNTCFLMPLLTNENKIWILKVLYWGWSKRGTKWLEWWHHSKIIRSPSGWGRVGAGEDEGLAAKVLKQKAKGLKGSPTQPITGLYNSSFLKKRGATSMISFPGLEFAILRFKLDWGIPFGA